MSESKYQILRDLYNSNINNPKAECIPHNLSSFKSKNNSYGILKLNGTIIYAHQLIISWKVNDGLEDINPNSVVRHLCNNKFCVNPHHLVTGTRSENQRDRYLTGSPTVGASSALRGPEALSVHTLQQTS